jgi:hypothetical protein
MSEPSILAILAGRHAYSLSPEDETAWCRACLAFGLIAGVPLGVWSGLLVQFMVRLLIG